MAGNRNCGCANGGIRRRVLVAVAVEVHNLSAETMLAFLVHVNDDGMRKAWPVVMRHLKQSLVTLSEVPR